MNYRIITTANFEKQAKKLVKKYHSLKKELTQLERNIISRHPLGTPIGKGAYKIRLAVRSKGKGKSGGLRIITYVEVDFFILDNTTTDFDNHKLKMFSRDIYYL